MTEDRKDPAELIREQAQRLFAQRVYILAHMTIFLALMVITSGRLARLGVVFAAWVIVLFGHFIFYSLYEQRESVIRRSYEKRKRLEQNHNLAEDDVFYDIGEDGELIYEDDDVHRQQSGM